MNSLAAVVITNDAAKDAKGNTLSTCFYNANHKTGGGSLKVDSGCTSGANQQSVTTGSVYDYRQSSRCNDNRHRRGRVSIERGGTVSRHRDSGQRRHLRRPLRHYNTDQPVFQHRYPPHRRRRHLEPPDRRHGPALLRAGELQSGRQQSLGPACGHPVGCDHGPLESMVEQLLELDRLFQQERHLRPHHQRGYHDRELGHHVSRVRRRVRELHPLSRELERPELQFRGLPRLHVDSRPGQGRLAEHGDLLQPPQ